MIPLLGSAQDIGPFSRGILLFPFLGVSSKHPFSF